MPRTDQELLPELAMAIDGTNVPLDPVVELSVSRRWSSPAHLRVRFDGDAAPTLRAAKAITFTVEGTEVFRGTVTAVAVDYTRQGLEVVADAYDASHQLAQRSVDLVLLRSTYADAIRRLCSDAGITAGTIASSLSTVTYDQIHVSGTPIRFLRDVCALHGLGWQLTSSGLSVTTPPTGGALTVEGDDLSWFNAEFASTEQAASVAVRGWNPVTKSAVVRTKQRQAPSGRPNAAATTAPASAAARIWPTLPVGADDAETVAAGAIAAMTDAELSGTGELTYFERRLEPGGLVALDKVHTDWNGTYRATAVEHRFGKDQPATTSFTIGGGADSLVDLVGGSSDRSLGHLTTGVTIGVVTNVHDEEGKQNRVKVKFPYLSDEIESAWARLVQPGAGAGRGLLVLPEVDDEVVVAFEHGDLRRPYVIGGLWNGTDAPPLNTTSEVLHRSGKVTSRSWTSREGHQIVLGDDGPGGKRISLTLGSKKVELLLSEDEIHLTHTERKPLKISTGGGSIEIADNGDITVKGANITLEAQQKLTLKGSQVAVEGQSSVEAKGAQVKINGSAGVGVQSGGMTEIKGSMVKVN